MKPPSFQTYLRESLQRAYVAPNKQLMKNEKKRFLQSLSEMKEIEHSQKLLHVMKESYVTPSAQSKKVVKNLLLHTLKDKRDQSSLIEWPQISFPFGRKALAFSFSFVLLSSTVFGPLTSLHIDLFPAAKAAMLECSGAVLLNGLLCTADSSVRILPGDRVETLQRGLATIYYNDYRLARLGEDSKLVLDSKSESTLNLETGSVWLHSPAGKKDVDLKVTAGQTKARLPMGSAGVTVRGRTTELVTTTAVVEVQIGDSQGATEMISLAPEKKLTIRSTSRETRTRETSLNKTGSDWVISNRQMDDQYREIVKTDTITQKTATAGVLPGSMGDYLKKMTHHARTQLTWDQEQKLKRQMVELDELFSEVLVLLENADKTTALQTFEAYQVKFRSLVDVYFDTIRVGNLNRESNRILSLLNKHTQVVSPFSSEDPQYILKIALGELAVQLERKSIGGAEEIIAGVITEKLLDAHQFVTKGKFDVAKELLKEANDLMAEMNNTSLLVEDSTNFTILDDIAILSPELLPLVKSMKKISVDQLRTLQAQHESREIIGRFIAGTAYKEVNDLSDHQDQLSTVKVVGQAIKEESL